MKKIFSVVISVLMILSIVPMVSFAEVTEPTKISTVEFITAIPKDGVSLVNESSVKDDTGIDAVETAWYEGENTESSMSFVFAGGTSYKVELKAVVSEGYVFDEAATATINGNTAEVYLNDTKTELTAQYTYTCKTTIKSLEIDVVTPVNGEKPYADCIVDNDNCEVVSVEWYASESETAMGAEETFAPGTYYAVITLKAKEGFEFTDMKAIINGEEAAETYINEDGTITAYRSLECVKEEEPPTIFAKILRLLKAAAASIANFFGYFLGL